MEVDDKAFDEAECQGWVSGVMDFLERSLEPLTVLSFEDVHTHVEVVTHAQPHSSRGVAS